MGLKKRFLSLALSTALAASPLAVSLAQGSYAAGELTSTAISDGYVGGGQINLSIDFDAQMAAEIDSAHMKAAVSLLDQSVLNMTFYDDFGTARIHGDLVTDGVTLLTADGLIYEDGSAQMMTNLTGKYVLALPAGSIQANGGLSLESLLYGEIAMVEDGEARSVDQRMGDALSSLSVTIMRLLLGWVSDTQMETGNLYVFDDTYLEPTELRDAVAQRMIGTIEAHKFNTLLWYQATSICDTQGDFQQALADFLADKGVTRRQARAVIDSLLTEETINPSEDWVQTSYYVYNEVDENALCEYDDVSYFFKKLKKSSQRIWEESLESMLSLIVSYDDQGVMVGLDADLPKVTACLPFEGFLNYSIKTDDNWQTRHTAHGEMTGYHDLRLVGDVDVLDGEDVDGVNDGHVSGFVDMVNLLDNTSTGVGMSNTSHYQVSTNEKGEDVESFTLSTGLSLRENGEDAAQLFSAQAEGVTTTDSSRFATAAKVMVDAMDLLTMQASVTLEQVEYEETSFAGGQAFDLTVLTEENIQTLKNEVSVQAAKLSLSLMMHPAVLSDLMTLVSK